MSTLYQYSSDHDWQGRAREYDRIQEARRRQELARLRNEVKARTYEASLKLHRVLVEQIEQLQPVAMATAESVAQVISQDDGVIVYRVEVSVTTKDLKDITDALARANRELRTAAELPSQYSSQKVDLEVEDKRGIERYLEDRSRQLEEGDS